MHDLCAYKITIIYFRSLPYVEATIAEVQRLGDIGPGSVWHKATRDSQIGSKHKSI